MPVPQFMKTGHSFADRLQVRAFSSTRSSKQKHLRYKHRRKRGVTFWLFEVYYCIAASNPTTGRQIAIYLLPAGGIQ